MENTLVDILLEQEIHPDGSRIVAEASYRDEFDGGELLRRNLIVDLAGCDEEVFSGQNGRSDAPDFFRTARLLRWFYFEEIEKTIGASLEQSTLAGKDREDTYMIYGKKISGLIRVAPGKGNSEWQVDYSLTVFDGDR